eukprot:8109-Pelagococcus_subviridis.AAC.2
MHICLERAAARAPRRRYRSQVASNIGDARTRGIASREVRARDPRARRVESEDASEFFCLRVDAFEHAFSRAR